MADPPIAAVTLDAGNTLLYCDPSPAEIYSKHLSNRGPTVTPDQVGPAFRDAWAEMQRRTAAGDDRYGSVAGGERAWWGAFVREVLARLDHPAPWRPLLDDLYEAFSAPEIWQTYDDTRPALTELATTSVRLAVISNWDRRLPRILDDLGLTGFFDTVTVSSLEGLEKPVPEIFHRTVERLGVEPTATIHVGDSPRDDYDGAAAAGLIPRLLDRHGLFEDDGYRRIDSLTELVDIVRGRGRRT